MASGRPQAVWLLVAVAALLALTVLAPASSGHHLGVVKRVDAAISETITLPVNNWTAYAFDMNAGDTLAYDVSVTSGGAIDLYIVPDVGLAAYANDTTVQFLEYVEVTNNRTFGGTFGGATGFVAVIVDNTNVGSGGATSTGPVTVSVHLVKSSGLFLGGLIFLTCGVVLLVVAVIVALVLQRRKATVLPPPPAPYGTPPVPYQPPPGPPPEAPPGPPEGPLPPQNP
jgi:hypothetical protein